MTDSRVHVDTSALVPYCLPEPSSIAVEARPRAAGTLDALHLAVASRVGARLLAADLGLASAARALDVAVEPVGSESEGGAR